MLPCEYGEFSVGVTPLDGLSVAQAHHRGPSLLSMGFAALNPSYDRWSPSPPSGAERVGVRWGIPERWRAPTSPSHCVAMGPSLSPRRAERGIPAAITPPSARTPVSG